MSVFPGLEAGEGSLKGQQGAMGALSLEPAPGGAAPTTDTGHQHPQGLRCAGHRAGCPEAKRMWFPSSRGGGLAGEKHRVRRNVKSSPGALWEVQSGPQGISGSVVVGGRVGVPRSQDRERLPAEAAQLPAWSPRLQVFSVLWAASSRKPSLFAKQEWLASFYFP